MGFVRFCIGIMTPLCLILDSEGEETNHFVCGSLVGQATAIWRVGNLCSQCNHMLTQLAFTFSSAAFRGCVMLGRSHLAFLGSISFTYVTEAGLPDSIPLQTPLHPLSKL